MFQELPTEMTTPTLLATLSKNDLSVIQISIQTFDGHDVVSLMEKTGATQGQCLFLQPHLLPALSEALAEAYAVYCKGDDDG